MFDCGVRSGYEGDPVRSARLPRSLGSAGRRPAAFGHGIYWNRHAAECISSAMHSSHRLAAVEQVCGAVGGRPAVGVIGAASEDSPARRCSGLLTIED